MPQCVDMSYMSECYSFIFSLICKAECKGEMLMRTLPTSLLELFCKIILNSKVIAKSTIDPDDNSFKYYWVNLYTSTPVSYGYSMNISN